MMLAFAIACFACSSLPAVMTLLNYPFFHKTRRRITDDRPKVSVCLPARNEAAVIAQTLDAVLASQGVELEVVVGDDHSEDDTRAIVEAIADKDPRVRLTAIAELPKGWSGKQHACWCLANAANHPYLVFIDADVTLKPNCLSRMVTALQQHQVDLISGFPRQRTDTLGESLLIPHIQFVLNGFLPFFFGRIFNHPAFAAGCGQLFLARRDPYLACKGHQAIQRSLHDGIHLPRHFRASGQRTHAVDASDLAECRMYHDFKSTWQGLAKNAADGMGAPGAIGPFTVLLGLGQVLPALLLLLAALNLPGLAGAVPWLLAALGVNTALHISNAIRFQQSQLTALLHPLGILLLLAIQWTALWNRFQGKPSKWRGREIYT